MKKLLKILFGIFSTTSTGQVETPKEINLNNTFDKVIQSDDKFKVSIIQRIPTFKNSATSRSSNLVYEKGKRIYNLKELFDNESYSKEDKIQYLKDAIADESIDALEYVGNNPIQFFEQSHLAKTLVDSYFDNKDYEASNDIYKKYKRFEFQTKNLFDTAESLITNYFETRPEINDRYHNEGDLIYRLVKLGKDKIALKYMKTLIDDFISDNTQGLQLGSRNEQMHTGYVFDILCFSENVEIRENAIDQLFYLLEHKDYNTHELYKLTSYLDKDRHIKLLEKRFEHFNNVDFSPLKDYETNEETKKNRRKLVSEANAFYSFMYTNSLHLGETKGKEVWQKFVETMPYWSIYGQPFEMSQMYILENCFKDKSLTQNDKIDILKGVLFSKRFYSDRDYHGSYKSRCLNLIVNTFPDKTMSEDLFKELKLEGFLSYSNPLEINDSELMIHPFRKQVDLTEIDSIIRILNNYASKNKINSIQLNDQKRNFTIHSKHMSLLYLIFSIKMI